MRKGWAMILILAICAVLPAADAEEIETVARALEFFSGVYGNTAFSLPATPEVLPEEDYPGVWTDSCQLIGDCLEDGAEFQLRCGDIGDFIDGFRERYPDEPEEGIRLSALINYCMFYPGTFGAEIGSVEPEADRENGRISAAVSFTYPDAPEQKYRCFCHLSGNSAVGLILQECAHTEDIRERFRFVTDAEREEILLEKSRPETADFYGLQLECPSPCIRTEKDGAEFLACFCADFTFLQVSYYYGSVETDAEQEKQLEGMMTIARKMLVPFETETVTDPVLSFPADGMLQLDYTAVNESRMGEYGQKLRCRTYAGRDGIWQITAADTETGRVFLNAARLRGASVAGPREGPVSFADFRAAMEDSSTYRQLGIRSIPDTYYWSKPILSGGEWVRVLCMPGFNAGARVTLAGDTPDSGILAVRVLRYAYDEEGRGDFLTFCGLCSIALRGEIWEGVPEKLAPEESKLVYERVILEPDMIPEAAETVSRPPQGSGMAMITRRRITAARFRERCASIAPLLGLECVYEGENTVGTDSIADIFTVGNAMLAVYLDGEGDEASVEIAVTMAEMENCPEALGAAMLAFAAIGELEETDVAALSWALIESPLWSDLCDLWPLLSDGKVCAHLQESADGEMAMGFVTGMPGNE